MVEDIRQQWRDALAAVLPLHVPGAANTLVVNRNSLAKTHLRNHVTPSQEALYWFGYGLRKQYEDLELVLMSLMYSHEATQLVLLGVKCRLMAQAHKGKHRIQAKYEELCTICADVEKNMNTQEVEF